MDYSTCDSEIADSLDFLCPPVCRTIYENSNIGTNKGNKKCRSYNSKIKKERTSRFKVSSEGCDSSLDSLSSLIISKTLNKQITQKQSDRVDSWRQKGKQRPLIKVTVIPASHCVSPCNHKRRKHIKVHRTVSNEEGHFQKQHVYLVLAGKNKDQLYEIKTTESAKFSNLSTNHRHYDDIQNTQRLGNLKKIFNYLGMEKKKKRIEIFSSKNGPDDSNEPESENIKSPKSDESKNRIKIYGRIGLTEDDKYVLKCAATVNDEPIDNEQLSPETLFMFPLRISSPKNNSNSLGIQVNISTPEHAKSRYDRKIQCNCVDTVDDGTYTSELESDNIIKSSLIKRNSPVVIISVYPNLDENEVNTQNKKISRQPLFTHSVLSNGNPKKMSADPISNFGRKDSSNLPTEQRKSSQENYNSREMKNSNNEKKLYTKNKKKTRARSQSPHSETSKKTLENRQEKQIKKRPTSPLGLKKSISKSKGLNSKSTDTEPQKRNINPSKDIQPKSLRQEIGRKKMVSKETNTKSPPGITQKAITKDNGNKTKLCNRESVESKARHDSNSSSTGQKLNQYNVKVNPNNKINIKSVKTSEINRKGHIATDTFDSNETKRSIIESFTNQYTSSSQASEKNHNQFTFTTKPGVSDVSINIDNPEENYDVAFHQNEDITDLRITKMNKDKPIKRVSYDDSAIKEDCCGKSFKGLSKAFFKTNDQSNLKNESSKISLQYKLSDSYRTQKTLPQSNVINSKSDFTVLGKQHFTGDECAVPDPLDRDKEIRKLLGVQRFAYCGDQGEDMNVIFEKGTKLSKIDSNMIETKSFGSHCHQRIRKQRDMYSSKISKFQTRSALIKPRLRWISKSYEMVATIEEKVRQELNKDCFPTKPTTATVSTQCEDNIEQTSIYQQLVLNRNVQVFLHVDEEKKHKPIILTRKQYDRIKRNIQKSLSYRNYDRCSYISKRSSVVSIGEIKRKPKNKVILHRHKCTQTDSSEDANKIVEVIKMPPTQNNIDKVFSQTQTHVDKKINKTSNHGKVKDDGNVSKIKKYCTPRQAMSSIEVQYASVSYMKHVTFSTTNFDEQNHKPVLERLKDKASLSILTLFKGHKRSITPNLGTSMYSLYPEGGTSSDKAIRIMEPNAKSKKPFLKRLMSCLVMRSENLSDNAAENGPPPLASVTSSVDSYHISTSLGALEISSSMYDTSESFFSNHTIFSINSKNKRGFLGSVWGFINRKS